MSVIDSLREKIRKGEPLPLPIAALLSAATPATRLGMLARTLRAEVTVDAHVISVGNLTAGGTGKTPVVLWHLDRLEPSPENRVAVLTRGYGTGNASETTVSTDVAAGRFSEVLGDEPALILRKHPDAIVIKGRDRVASARLAIERFRCRTLILDDGYQYLRLHRDVNQLLIDAANPFGNGRLVPRGILREPLFAIGRATEVLLTRCDLADPAPIEAVVRRYHPNVPIRRLKQTLGPIRHAATGAALASEDLRGREVDIACAIGHPEAFATSIERTFGVRIVRRHLFRDHAKWNPSDLPSDRPLLTTEKDEMRIANPSEHLYVVEMRVEDWNPA